MHLLKRPHDEPRSAQALPPPGLDDGPVDAPPPLIDEPPSQLDEPPSRLIDEPPAEEVGLEPADDRTPRSGRGPLIVVLLAGSALAVVAIVAIFLLLRPVPDFVVSSFEIPEVVLDGEPVVAAVSVTNDGGAAGEYEFTLLLDGAPARTERFSGEAGATETFRIDLGGLAPGTYTVSLDEGSDFIGVVWVLEPPLVELDQVVTTGDVASLEITLGNEGTATVTHELVLLVEGARSSSESIQLAAGQETTVSFTTGGLAVGTHELSLALSDWTGSIGTVWAIDPPLIDLDEVVVTGEAALVEVLLTNEGTVPVAHDLELLVDGVRTGSEPVELAPGDEIVVTFSTRGLEPGTHEFSLALANWASDLGTVWVVEQPRVTFPEVVAVGEVGTGSDADGARPTAAFDVIVGLGNAGPATITNEVTLALSPGAWNQTRPIRLAAGVNTTITFPVSGISPGTYELLLTVGDLEQVVGSVWVPTPARFELGDLTVSPSPIDINTTRELVVLTEISNLGEADGTYPATLSLDGVPVETRDIAVAGGERVEETFLVDVATPGPHEVTLGENTVRFDAYQLQRPSNGAVLFNEIGGGSNRLRITNNRTTDVLVVLTAPGDDQPGLLGVYVRAESTATVRGIRSGTYSHYYVFGQDWCEHNRSFTSDTSYGRFALDGVYESSGSMYTQMDIEFGITDGLGSPTNRVSEDAFPGW